MGAASRRSPITRPHTETASRLRQVTHPTLEVETRVSVPSLAQPATEAKRTFASFFRQKEDHSPRLPGEPKYRRSQRQGPQPSWLAQGCYLGGDLKVGTLVGHGPRPLV